MKGTQVTSISKLNAEQKRKNNKNIIQLLPDEAQLDRLYVKFILIWLLENTGFNKIAGLSKEIGLTTRESSTFLCSFLNDSNNLRHFNKNKKQILNNFLKSKNYLSDSGTCPLNQTSVDLFLEKSGKIKIYLDEEEIEKLKKHKNKIISDFVKNVQSNFYSSEFKNKVSTKELSRKKPSLSHHSDLFPSPPNHIMAPALLGHQFEITPAFFKKAQSTFDEPAVIHDSKQSVELDSTLEEGSQELAMVCEEQQEPGNHTTENESGANNEFYHQVLMEEATEKDQLAKVQNKEELDEQCFNTEGQFFNIPDPKVYLSNINYNPNSVRERARKFHLDDLSDIKDLEEIAHFKYMFEDKNLKKKIGKNNPVYIGYVDHLGSNGLGSFAKEDIPASDTGQILGFYLGATVGRKIYFTADPNTINTSYFMDIIGSNGQVSFIYDAFKTGNWPRFVNDTDDQPNTVYFQKGNYILLKTLPGITIKKDDQLLVSYGDSFKRDYKKKFLNSDNNYRTPDDILYENIDQYIVPNRDLLEKIQKCLFSKNDTFYIPRAISSLLEDTHCSTGWKPGATELPVLLFKNDMSELKPSSEQPGITPLMILAILGEYEKMEWLLKHHSINISQQNTITGHTAIFYAVMSSSSSARKVQIIQLLLKYSNRSDLLFQDEDDLTPLHWLVKKGDLETIKELLLNDQEKIKKDLLDTLLYVESKNKFCPLSYALYLCQYEIFEFLLEQYIKKYNQQIMSEPGDIELFALACQKPQQALFYIKKAIEFNVSYEHILFFAEHLKQNGVLQFKFSTDKKEIIFENNQVVKLTHNDQSKVTSYHGTIFPQKRSFPDDSGLETHKKLKLAN